MTAETELTDPELKMALRQSADEKKIDLSHPDNRFTLWTRNGWPGYLFWGGASYPSRVHELMDYYMFSDAIILEGNESGDVVRRFRCSVG